MINFIGKRCICWVIILCFMNVGCASRFVAVKQAPEIASYLHKIETHNQRITQVKASLDIRAQGILSGFFHEQADVVVQLPHYLFWSLRSFFSLPTMIIASNGEFLTAYDFSGQSPEPYQIRPLHRDTFFEVMDFRLHPGSLIYLLTQHIPLTYARDLQFSVNDNRLLLRGILDGGWTMQAIFDVATNCLTVFQLQNDVMMITYEARYVNYHLVNGILFPSSVVLLAKGKSRSAKLHIEFTETELNGEQVLPDVFYVKPH